MALRNPWEPPAKIEKEYQRAIRRAMGALLGITTVQGLGDAVDILTVSPEWHQLCREIAARMVTNTLTWEDKTWRAAARRGSRGREIYQGIQEILQTPVGETYRQAVEHNAQLISSLPEDIRAHVNEMISDRVLKGYRPEDIAGLVERFLPEEVKTRSMLIARTESAKAHTELTRARAQAVRMNWYMWHSTHDSRTRPSHRKMDGVICSWDDPPSPEALNNEKSYGRYPPGGIWNCRCYPEPINPDMIAAQLGSGPFKVYRNGQIRTMTLKQLERMILNAA